MLEAFYRSRTLATRSENLLQSTKSKWVDWRCYYMFQSGILFSEAWICSCRTLVTYITNRKLWLHNVVCLSSGPTQPSTQLYTHKCYLLSLFNDMLQHLFKFCGATITFLITYLPASSFVCHSSLLTAKCVDLVVAHDGFLSQWKSSIFFVVVILSLIGTDRWKQSIIDTSVFRS